MLTGDIAMLSRSGQSNAGGKLTSRLDVPIPEDLEEAVISLATISGVSKAEWVRAVIERAVFGELAVVRRMSQLGRAVNPTNVGTSSGEDA